MGRKKKRKVNKKSPVAKVNIQELMESRDGGQIALRGYSYQFLYSCYLMLSCKDENTVFNLEGIGDIDKIVSTSDEQKTMHIQLKYSENKPDASFMKSVLKNFLEAYLLDKNRAFKLVYDFSVAKGHLSKLVNNILDSEELQYWKDTVDEIKNEKKELYNLIKKSKRNQKYSKINVLYNEKFFDKTVFVNMKNNEGKEEANKMIIDNNINDNNNNISTINDNKAITGKENIKYDYSQSINNEILEFNRTFQRMKTTPLYNNSLIDIEKNENSIFNKKGDQTFEENVVNNFSSSLINKIHSIPFDNNSVNNKNIKKTKYR